MEVVIGTRTGRCRSFLDPFASEIFSLQQRASIDELVTEATKDNDKINGKVNFKVRLASISQFGLLGRCQLSNALTSQFVQTQRQQLNLLAQLSHVLCMLQNICISFNANNVGKYT